jgi:hypothetical protein
VLRPQSKISHPIEHQRDAKCGKNIRYHGNQEVPADGDTIKRDNAQIGGAVYQDVIIVGQDITQRLA